MWPLLLIDKDFAIKEYPQRFLLPVPWLVGKTANER